MSGGGINYDDPAVRLFSQTSIRLLKILPSSSYDRVDCVLSVVDLAGPYVPEYTCLSYTGGSPFPNAQEDIQVYIQVYDAGFISVNACEIAVKLNLNWTLISLYQHGFLRPGSLVWVDAICINQSNIVERGEQVRLMQLIFRRATNTLAWLGPETADTGLALTLIDRIGSVKGDLTPPNFGKLALHNFRDPEVYEVLGIEVLQEEHWLAFARFMDRTWFSRIWTLQESILSDTLYLVCGRTLVNIDQLACPLYMIEEARWRYKFPYEAWGCDSLARATGMFVVCRRRRNVDGILDMRLLQSCVAQVLRKSHHAHDPRDFIYGLLGCTEAVFRTRIFPDYTKSVRRVFQQATRAFIDTTLTLDVLSRIDLSESERHSEYSLPSWVPDYASPPAFVGLFSLTLESPYEAAGSSKPVISNVPDPDVLCVLGYRLSLVDDKAMQATRQCREQYGGNWPVMVYATMLDQLADSNVVREADGESVISVVWRTGAADKKPLELHPPPERERCFRRWLIWNVARHLANLDPDDPQHETIHDLIAPTMSEADLGTTAFLSEVLLRQPELADADDHHETTPEIDSVRKDARLFASWQAVGCPPLPFAAAAAAADADDDAPNLPSPGRSLYLTATGHLMLASTFIAPADEVWILHGSSVPFVLRPQPRSPHAYRLVCSAYVHGAMKGETFEDHDAQRTWVQLV